MRFGARISCMHSLVVCIHISSNKLKRQTKPHRHQPRQKLPILNEGMPLSQLPIHILQRRHRLDANPTKQYHHTRTARRYETQNERILGGAIVAFQDGIAQRRLGMELDLVRSRANQVMYEMGAAASDAGCLFGENE